MAEQNQMEEDQTKTAFLRDTTHQLAKEITQDRIETTLRDLTKLIGEGIATGDTFDKAVHALLLLRKDDDPPPHIELPPAFKCPISGMPLTDPVVLASGEACDRETIINMFDKGLHTCPSTFKALPHTSVTPNLLLGKFVNRFCDDNKLQRPVPPPIMKNYGVEISKADKICLESLLGRLSPTLEEKEKAAEDLHLWSKLSHTTHVMLKDSPPLYNQLLIALSSHNDNSSKKVQECLMSTLRDVFGYIKNNEGMLMELGGNPALVPLLISTLANGTFLTKANALYVLFILSRHEHFGLGKQGIMKVLVGLIELGDMQMFHHACPTITNLCLQDEENKSVAVDDGIIEAIKNKISDTKYATLFLPVLRVISTNRGAVERIVEMGLLQDIFNIALETQSSKDAVLILDTLRNLYEKKNSLWIDYMAENDQHSSLDRIASFSEEARAKMNSLNGKLREENRMALRKEEGFYIST